MRRTSGLPLLILIFVSLCLITFSLLSVSESRADQTLGEKMAARTTTYYEANTKANQLLSKVDAQLANYLRQFHPMHHPPRKAATMIPAARSQMSFRK